MNIEDMRAWIASYETGSIQRASLKLNLTQPAVTRRLQRLEESLGVLLLNRESKPAKPTPVGRNVYRDCLRIVRDADALQRRTKENNQLAGDLRIGVSYGVMESVFGPSIDRLRQTYPDLRLRITGGRNAEIIPLVNQYRLDAAIIVSKKDNPPENANNPIYLGQESVSVVAQKTAGFSNQTEIGELAGFPWIINPEGCAYRNQLERALRSQKLCLNVAVETWGVPFLLSLVARGMGIGLTPTRCVKESPYAEELQILNIREFDPKLDIMMVRSTPHEQENPVLVALADCISEALGSN